ncbi:MAG: hypothetical protein HY962_07590 [Ignavibacteriae bacterium]|nr:hypothetical protein [Ignavibacteriota bacterium]
MVEDICFHMTDWRSDLEMLASFFDAPNRYTDDEVVELLYIFLVHVPNHVAAAAKLLCGIPVEDIFDVGAVSSAGLKSRAAQQIASTVARQRAGGPAARRIARR